jgi:hypothetical protein
MQRTKAVRYVTVGILTLIVLVIFVSYVDHNIYGVNSNKNMNINLSSSLRNHFDYEDMNQSTMNKTMMKMLERGNVAMGFNQNKITHQFIATPFGGEIIITALNASDRETIDQIKNHLLEIQKQFSQGNFTKPFFIHAQEVPGTKVMFEKKDLIKYSILEMKNGSSLMLTTNDTQLVDAINQFMEFQAGQHQGH